MLPRLLASGLLDPYGEFQQVVPFPRTSQDPWSKFRDRNYHQALQHEGAKVHLPVQLVSFSRTQCGLTAHRTRASTSVLPGVQAPKEENPCFPWGDTISIIVRRLLIRLYNFCKGQGSLLEFDKI